MIEVTISLLILIGILLILVEFLLAPGITIAGIGGLLLIGFGVYLAYSNFENIIIGHLVLSGSIVATLIALYFSLRSKTWKKFMLDSKIEGNVNTMVYEEKIKPGDIGKALTRLNPIGKVMVNDIVLEGKSNIGFIDENSEIVVIKVEKRNIIVKLK